MALVEMAVCQAVANYLGSVISIGITPSDGNCFFCSLIILFGRHPSLLERNVRLTSRQMREWVAKEFVPENFQQVETVVTLWKSMYEDAYMTGNEDDLRYYSFIETVAPYLPPTEGMRQRVVDKRQEIGRLEAQCAVPSPDGNPQAHELLAKCRRELEVFERYICKETERANIPEALRLLRHIVQTREFWAEDISIHCVVNKLAELLDTCVGIFIVSTGETGVALNPILSKTHIENYQNGVFAFVYFTRGIHYQPLKVDRRLLHSFNQLPENVFKHWKVPH